MKKITTILAGLLTLMLSACSSDDTTTTREVTLDIPIEIYTGNKNLSLRAADQGDPGNDVVFKAPLYLYVYAFVSENNGNDCELLTQTITFSEDELASGWKLNDEDTAKECWRKSVRVTFRISRAFNNALGESRVYAIASRTDLSKLLPSTETVTAYTEKSTLEAMKVDCSSFTSDQLKDIYSTPTNDQSNPVASTDNGIIVGNNNMLTCSTVKLYHVAAKADFQWEIPSSLRKTVEMQEIECTNLPTTCKIFEPTNNPAGTGSSIVIGLATRNPANTITEGNKWIGRAYAFMLQPPSPGTINYTVTFDGSGLRPNTYGSITPSIDAYSNVFTGWYRVSADVQ